MITIAALTCVHYNRNIKKHVSTILVPNLINSLEASFNISHLFTSTKESTYREDLNSRELRSLSQVMCPWQLGIHAFFLPWHPYGTV